jgi:hypothetical protein
MMVVISDAKFSRDKSYRLKLLSRMKTYALEIARELRFIYESTKGKNVCLFNLI